MPQLQRVPLPPCGIFGIVWDVWAPFTFDPEKNHLKVTSSHPARMKSSGMQAYTNLFLYEALWHKNDGSSGARVKQAGSLWGSQAMTSWIDWRKKINANCGLDMYTWGAPEKEQQNPKITKMLCLHFRFDTTVSTVYKKRCSILENILCKYACLKWTWVSLHYIHRLRFVFHGVSEGSCMSLWLPILSNLDISPSFLSLKKLATKHRGPTTLCHLGTPLPAVTHRMEMNGSRWSSSMSFPPA